MKKLILLITLMLLTSISYCQSYYFSVKPGYNVIWLPKKQEGIKFVPNEGKSINLEYCLLFDQNTYYNGIQRGFTTGISYVDQLTTINYFGKNVSSYTESLSIPILYTSKATEWNDYIKLGIVYSYDYNQVIDEYYQWNPYRNKLDAYFSFGFDNEFSIRSNWRYVIAVYSEYNLTSYSKDVKTKLIKTGLLVGINYQLDWYHYHNKGEYKRKRY